MSHIAAVQPIQLLQQTLDRAAAAAVTESSSASIAAEPQRHAPKVALP